MAYTLANDNSFLDIKNAHLRVMGNVHATAMKIGAIEVVPGYSLERTANVGNTTTSTIQFTNPTTSLVTSGNVSVGGELTVTGNVAVDTNTLFVDSVNDRVGVGTATPTTALDVVGTVTATAFAGAVTGAVTGNASTATKLAASVNIGGVAFDGSAAIVLPGVDTTGTQNTSGSAATLTTARAIGGVSFDGSMDITPTTFTTATFSGDVTVDSTTFHVDSTNNRVGVGTTSPGKLLEISGASGLDNSSPVHFRITNTQSATTGSPFTDITKPAGLISFYTPDTSTAGPGDVAGIGFRPESTLGGDTALCFYTNSENDDAGTPLQERMCITHDGNVGIGTTIPQTSLQIKDETDTTGTGDAFITGLSGNTSNRKPTECLRLQGKYHASGSGALLRFTNQHDPGTNPNTGEYNLAGIAGFDYASAWGGGLCFYTAPTTSNGGDLTARMVISKLVKSGSGRRIHKQISI